MAEDRELEEYNESDLLGSRLDMAGEKPIHVIDYNYENGIEYLKVAYDGDIRNLLVHSTVYDYGESPYNQEIEKVPYIVIKGDVYEISSFISIGYRDEDYRKV